MKVANMNIRLSWFIIPTFFSISLSASGLDLSPIGKPVPINGTGSARVVFRYTKVVREYNMENLLDTVSITKGIEGIDSNRIDATVQLLSTLTGLPSSQMDFDDRRIIFCAYSQTNQTARTRTQVKASYYTNHEYVAPSNWNDFFSLVPDRVQICHDGQEFYKHSVNEPWDIYPAGGGAIPRFEKFGHTVFTREKDLLQTNHWAVTTLAKNGTIVYTYTSQEGGPLATEIGLEIERQPPHHILRTWYGTIQNPWKEYIFSDYIPLENHRAFPRHTTIRKMIPLPDGPFIAEEEQYSVIGKLISFYSPNASADWFNPNFWDLIITRNQDD